MSGININGNEISWAYVMRIKNRAGGDWDVVQDIFWKARNCTGGARGIMRYIEAGFKKVPGGAVPYNLQASKEREAGNMEKIRAWWEESVYQRKKQNKPMQLGDIMRAAMGVVK